MKFIKETMSIFMSHHKSRRLWCVYQTYDIYNNLL